jgi:uncharacterized protein (TIGR02246 family)
MRIRSLWLVPVVLGSGACEPAEPRTNSDADLAAIGQLYKQWPRAIEAADAAQYVTFLDDSITLLMPGAAAVHGVAAYRSLLTPLFQAARYRVALSPPNLLEVAGPWAFAQYEGEATTLSATGADSVTARNRYVDILRRQADGAWRVWLHSWHNAASPAR